MASPKTSEENIERKMQAVSNTQDSVQSLSLWIIHHKSQHKRIVDVWYKVIKKSSTKHKLTLFNVCNDVVQNGKRKHAAVYVDTFRDILKDAIVYVGEEKIKSNVERILNIWKERNVFPASFVSELQETLASAKAKAKVSTSKVKESSHVKEVPPSKVKDTTTKIKDTSTKVKDTKFASALASPKASKTPINPKILAEFKPQKVIDKINNFKRLEGEVELKGKQLSNLKLDASSIEAIKQLKDKAHGKQFSQQFEDSCFKLEDFVTSIEKEIEEQQSMIEVLEQSEMFYDEQYREAKIVANAYKNFGTRINNLKKKLDDLKESLPSPIPSPSSDAPSPGNTPPDAELEMNETVDMDLDDEDSTSPSNIIVVKHSKRKVANTITVNCIPQPIPSVLDIGLAGKAAAFPSKDSSSNKTSNSTSGIQYIQTVGGSKSLTSTGKCVENALESRIAKMIPTLQPLNQHHDPRQHESEPAVYNPPPKKHSSITSLQSAEHGEGTPTKDEGSSTPVMDEKPESPPNDRNSVPPSSKSQNPIDFLTQILSKTSKSSQGSSNFLQNLSLLTSTVKTQYQQQKEANSHQGTGSSSPSLEQQSTPPNSWAEWKAQRQPSPSQISSPSEHQMAANRDQHIPAFNQSTSQPQEISPQKIPTLQGNAQQQITPVLAPSQQPILQQPPLSIGQIGQPHNPALVQPVLRPPQIQPPYQQAPPPQIPYRHDVPVPPMMPGGQVPVAGWTMPLPPQGFPMPGYLGPPPPGQAPQLGSPPWGPTIPQQPEVKVSTSDQEMSDDQTTSPGLKSPPISQVSNQPKGILRNRKSSLREVPLTPDPIEAAREFSGGLESDLKPRPPSEPPSPTESGKSKLGRQNSDNVNIVDDHKEFMEKLKRKTTGNSNLIAPPIVDFPDEEMKLKQQVYTKNPTRPNLTTITPIDLDDKHDEKETEEEERERKNFTELSADESEELPIQTIKSVVTKGPQSMETSSSGENEGAPIKTIDSTVRTKIDMQGDHNNQDKYHDSDRKKYDSAHHGHRSEHYTDYYRSESHNHRDRHDSYRHHRDRPYYDPYQSRGDFYRDRYGAQVPRGYPDYYSGRRYQRY
ncbi:hypothetical protein KUTeg_018155 [Tegillarca granosa]|uniref:CID domain-containing protein n=1 Tax=Tegillarca granosa TaxID=220873 RepID=A0ABQ9ELV0_TEGGR|nr:hypothetical protein KUTeg_018155 [Tegillarca granosa]